MKITGFLLALVLGLSTAAMFTGCTKSSDTKAPEGEAGHGDHDHGDHGHDHEHSHAGPHGGKVFVIGDEEYHGEWTHDDTGKVSIYLLDSAMKETVPTASPSVTIDVKVGEETKTYELPAVNPTADEPPTAFQFEIVDAGLGGALEAVSEGGVQATLKVVINSKPYSVKITKEEHSHAH